MNFPFSIGLYCKASNSLNYPGATPGLNTERRMKIKRGGGVAIVCQQCFAPSLSIVHAKCGATPATIHPYVVTVGFHVLRKKNNQQKQKKKGGGEIYP